jgi:hypothetical protein
MVNYLNIMYSQRSISKEMVKFLWSSSYASVDSDGEKLWRIITRPTSNKKTSFSYI